MYRIIKLVRNEVFLVTLFKSFGALCTILIGIYISNSLGSKEFGHFSVFLSLVTFGSMFGKAGLDLFFLRKGIEEEKNKKLSSLIKKIYIRYLIVQILVLTILYFSIKILSSSSVIFSSILESYHILSFSVILLGSSDIFCEIERIKNRVQFYALKKFFIYSFSMLVFSIALTEINYTKYAYEAVFFGGLVYFISSLIGLRPKGKLFYSSPNDSQKVFTGTILRESIPMMFVVGMTFLMGYADTYMISVFLYPEDNAYYAAIMKISAAITFFTSIVITIRAKGIVDEHIEGKDLSLHFSRTTKVILAITFPILVVVYIFGDFLLGLYGDGYSSYYMILLVYVFASIINSLPFGYYYVLTDRQEKFLIIVAVGLSINVILNYLLIPVFGIEGAVWTTLISNIFVNVVAFLYLKITKVL